MPASASVAASGSPGRVPAIWGNVPQRNKNFTGREDLLLRLRERVNAQITAVLPHTLQGLGGVGKTQLMIEYAYRYGHEYDLVWWIPADQEALVRSTLAALAPRLGITGIPIGRVDEAARAALDALRRGEPYRRWLLIFDNADQPESIREFMPHGSGHVLVTSRNHRWHSFADTLEVNVFRRTESVEFLRRRVTGTDEREAEQLAEELGDLPLALEQAGALMAETAMPVETYLDLLAERASKILEENPPSDYPVSVAAAWGLSVAQLSEQMPYAMDLLRRCAFFGPEPIPIDLLARGRYVLDPPLRTILADPIQLSRAHRELGRYALARIDNLHKTLQVHRLIQRVIRDEVPAEDAERMRHEVHLLLAAADPGDPDDIDNWSTYADLLAHVEPAASQECKQPEVRRLCLNMVRYLYVIGDESTALRFAERIGEEWTTTAGPDVADQVDILIMSRHRADLLWALGRYRAAYDQSAHTLAEMRRLLGEEHEETLLALNTHGAHRRGQGDFEGARELDEVSLAHHRRVFGENHRRTFMAANNLAVDYSLTSDYERARELDEQTYAGRRDFFGRDDHPTTLLSLSALGRDHRQGGHYRVSLELEERTYQAYERLVQQGVLVADHRDVLTQAKDLAVALRKVGDFDRALRLSQNVYDRYVRRFGEDHPDTLSAAITLGNAKRLAGELHDAVARFEDAALRSRRVFGTDHPLTYGITLNLAIVYRQLGEVQRARFLLDEAVAGLRDRLGDAHHYTLTGATNLASSLASLGEVDKACELGSDSLRRFREVLGPDHPHALACAANLALDLRATGQGGEADRLAAEAVDGYRRTLGPDHPDSRDAAAGKRLDFDFDPPPL